MTERLTDHQVAALTATANVRDTRLNKWVMRDGLNWTVGPEEMCALAAEVQQSRQRRCDNCAHWASSWVTGGAAGWCEGPPPCCRNETVPDYYCANFKAKP
jgi:hypothetical protein